MNLFGKKPKAPEISESLPQLRQALEIIEKRETHLQKLADESLKQAKLRMKNKDKKGGMFELRKKKMYEKQIEASFGKKINLHNMIMALENAEVNKKLLAAMKNGAKAMEPLVSDKAISEAEDVMQDLNDKLDQVDQMNDLLSQPIGEPEDEDALLLELDELEDQMVAEEMIELPTEPLEMPVVPSKAVTKDLQLDDAQLSNELKKLEAELAI
eukprot:TRINITY_DN3838_c1_g2_i3.p1 TRINITY_DN3838_c1_g2~~TRINITY_DN3838_c1_g2_i3.p1  ORF type:complete len:213 (-),score=90.67 TRINITY_DN3838_c1_g2_i3:55-693(-)